LGNRISKKMTTRNITGHLRLLVLRALCAALSLGVCACATTDIAARDRLSAEAMAFEPNDGLQYLRLKMEAAREASLGGYGEASAGGCGCQ
jgi:hypothetical protein